MLYFGMFYWLSRWTSNLKKIFRMPATPSRLKFIQKILTAIQGIQFWPWSAPLALLVLVALGYGPRALTLGFFWDDWPYLWIFHSLGPEGITSALAQDRPFLGFIYVTTLSLFGNSAPAWQVFAILMRWLCTLGVWWALLQVWPGSSPKVFWVAALFAVYPGFSQQWIAIIYGQAFLLFAAMLLSLAVTLWLARTSAGPVFAGAGTLAALALSAFTMFSTEYFFGLELIRPVLLWLVLGARQDGQARSIRDKTRLAWRAARWWAPYLAVMIAFVVWRGFIHTFPGKRLTVVEGMGSSAVRTAVDLSLTMAEDLVEAVLLAWGQTLNADLLIGWGSTRDLRLPILMVSVAGLLWFYLVRLRPARASTELSSEAASAERWALQAVAIGLLAFLASGWPFWITGLPMRLGFPQDRYSLPLALGACLLVAGMVDAAGRNLPFKAAVLGMGIALAIGFQLQMAQAYRQDWVNMQNLMWQMTWRAPSIRPNTLLLTDSMGLRFYEDDSLAAPINWTYDPDNRGDQMNYMLFDLLVRKSSFKAQDPAVEVEREFRGKFFSGSSSQVLVMVYNPPGCLKILDPVYDAALPRMPERVLRVLPLSAPQEWIEPAGTPAAPPVEIFGSEPRRRWCYYYQKASLARQTGDWEEVVRLAGESLRRGIRPERPQDQVEFLPFIEGYARMGLWDDAAQMTVDTAFWAPDVQPALCLLWERSIQGKPPDETMRRGLGLVNENLNCGIK